MEFGERLTQERKRLKLSQANFAKAVGVSISSQKWYESNVRQPNVSYLKSLEDIGVDAFFVLNGRRSAEIRKELLGIADDGSYREALPILLLALGIDEEAWNNSLGKMMPTVIENAEGNAGGDDPSVYIDLHDPEKRYAEHLAPELIRLSPVLTKKINEASDLSLSIISDVVEKLETVLKDSGKEIQPAKKAQAVVMLYRAFKASGKVDQKMIEEAVSLAGS